MAVRSRDFVGIAEGIRNQELSTKSRIENLRGRMSELSGRKASLNNTISYLEAAIAAAYEDTDEDGDPDYARIASLQAQLDDAEDDLAEVRQDISSTGSELENKQGELEKVEEEKAQALFEIQERARKTSNNISLAGGMYGAYSGTGGALQNSLQTSLNALSRAAGILGGSVDGASSGGNGGHSGARGGSSDHVGTNLGDSGVRHGPLSAFSGGYAAGAMLLPASQFNTDQDHSQTPATIPNFHSGRGSINTRSVQSFSTEQNANEYVLSSFGDTTTSSNTSQGADGYRSNQASPNMENQFSSSDSSILGSSDFGAGSGQHSFADWINPENYVDGRYIGSEQNWGYKPYGNDSHEYASTVMSAEQLALHRYMQTNNYGRADFIAFSKDPEWQRLHQSAYPDSKLVDSLRGSPLARQHLAEYMYAHNYTQADFVAFSKDPEWQRLHHMAYPNSNVGAALAGSHLARQHLREYMYEHQYGHQDFYTYSRDPEWQRLHRNAYPENYSQSGQYTYGGITQSSNIKPTTSIDASVKDISSVTKLSDSLGETFYNGEYRTVVATEDIVLYRVYGGASKKEGTFLTSEKPIDRMNAKMGLALKAEWKNSRINYSKVIVPKGTILYIGKAAPQLTASGHILPGGMDQIVVTKKFVAENPQAFRSSERLDFHTGYREFNKKALEIEAQLTIPKKTTILKPSKGQAKNRYSDPQKKIEKIRNRRKDREKKFLQAVLHKANVRSEALDEIAENMADFTENAKAYTEVCWLPEEHELNLAMAKADALSSGFNAALISMCVVAAAIKNKLEQ